MTAINTGPLSKSEREDFRRLQKEYKKMLENEKKDKIRVKVYMVVSLIVAFGTLALIWFGDFSYKLT